MLLWICNVSDAIDKKVKTSKKAFWVYSWIIKYEKNNVTQIDILYVFYRYLCISKYRNIKNLCI